MDGTQIHMYGRGKEGMVVGWLTFSVLFHGYSHFQIQQKNMQKGILLMAHCLCMHASVCVFIGSVHSLIAVGDLLPPHTQTAWLIKSLF